MNRFSSILNIVLFPSKKTSILIGIGLSSLVPLVYLLVYQTGGIKFVYSHTMYIPIVLIGVIFGLKWGIITAIFGAILLGPLMPIDTLTGEKQELANWLYRTLIFVSIGAFSGYFSDTLRKRQRDIVSLLSRNQESDILLFNALSHKIKMKTHHYPVYIIRVLNQDLITDKLGIQTYLRLWQHVSQEIEDVVELEGTLYQLDNRLFAFVSDCTDVDFCLQYLTTIFHSSHQIDEISLYLEAVIGYNDIPDQLATMVQKAVSASRIGEMNHQAVIKYLPSFSNEDLSLTLLADVGKAIQEEELFLEYQTFVDAKTNKVIGMEALIRWKHPIYGLLPPLEFIPIIEQSQQIHNLTMFVLNKVKADMMPHALKNNLFISINLTTNNLFDDLLINQILSNTFFNQDEKEHLVIEITESSFITNPQKAMTILQKVKSYGIRIALDDFGTGYSSLSYLGQYPLDIIKVDKSFIPQLFDKRNRMLLETIINLSRGLTYQVVVEGVETEFIAKQLATLQCDILQGYYFSKPQTKDKVIHKFHNN